ncbi:putative phosphorylase b kinase regulatory subunit alpha, partial [Fasciola hepatica]
CPVFSFHSVTLGTLKNFEETSSVKQLSFIESCDTVSLTNELRSLGTRRRRLTHLEATESFLMGDESTGCSPYSNPMGLASPTVHSGSSAGLNYEQDSFQRYSMRRKSMALAHAVNMDLINHEQNLLNPDDAQMDNSWADTDTDTNTAEAVNGSHLLRQRTEHEDLSCNASKLALRRMLNPDSSTVNTRFPLAQNTPISIQQSTQLQSDANAFLDHSSSRTSSASHSRRQSETGGSQLGTSNPGPDWLSSLTPEQLVGRLTHTDNLAEQAELLGRLHQLQGLDWDTGIDPSQPAHVRTLLKEVYERASQATSWFLLRYTAGLLGKRAGSLAKSLTDILVLQKQVTVGLPPEPREIVIDAPLTPDQIAHVIQKACGEDSLMNVLTQEILIYLSMLARTKPQQLANILRLRIGLIIQMMGTELARTMCMSAEDSLHVLFSMSPFDMKRLLQNLLSGEEIRMVKTTRAPVRRKSTVLSSKVEQFKSVATASARRISVHSRALSRLPSLAGVAVGEEAHELRGMEMRNLWSRRRKIDGALNRVPPGFYERVYIVLSRIQGLEIFGHTLCSSLTREMTMEEHKFALAVERVITMVPSPEYRQLLIEATHVLGTLMMHDVEKSVHLDCIVKVDEIVDTANVLFLLDHVKYDANATLCCAKALKEQNISTVVQAQSVRKPGTLLCHGLHGICQHFYDTPPAGRFGTMSYMVRAVSYLLQSTKPIQSDGVLSVNCSVQ